MINRIRIELMNIRAGLITTFFLALLLGLWRVFDSRTFLFLQILLCCFLLYMLLHILENRVRIFSGRQLLSILIAFTLISFMTLNIDRSRSFFLLKWVGQYENTSGTTVEYIATKKSLSTSEVTALNQRVQEQKESIMLKGDGGKVKLTLIGRSFVKV